MPPFNMMRSMMPKFNAGPSGNRRLGMGGMRPPSRGPIQGKRPLINTGINTPQFTDVNKPIYGNIPGGPDLQPQVGRYDTGAGIWNPEANQNPEVMGYRKRMGLPTPHMFTQPQQVAQSPGYQAGPDYDAVQRQPAPDNLMYPAVQGPMGRPGNSGIGYSGNFGPSRGIFGGAQQFNTGRFGGLDIGDILGFRTAEPEDISFRRMMFGRGMDQRSIGSLYGQNRNIGPSRLSQFYNQQPPMNQTYFG